MSRGVRRNALAGQGALSDFQRNDLLHSASTTSVQNSGVASGIPLRTSSRFSLTASHSPARIRLSLAGRQPGECRGNVIAAPLLFPAPCQRRGVARLECHTLGHFLRVFVPQVTVNAHR